MRRLFPVKKWIFIPVLLCTSIVYGQIPTNGLDVQHYDFSIDLNDTTDIIRGKAEITTDFTKEVSTVNFDLRNANAAGKGMTVTAVTKNDSTVAYTQTAQSLVIQDSGSPGSGVTYTITYRGIPADGLIISNTKYGQRSFFADNWPNRARNWIPCNDHLSDKATVAFNVTAPVYYQVVSNGRKVEESDLPGNRRFTRWMETAQLPTKVMVIGVTRFAVQYVGNADTIPVSSWVLPENRDSGFVRYAMGRDILKWYIDHIGAYGFEKLANVQSKTMFGGMENAGCIFYFENSVSSPNLEALFAHEIAHQWFGDNVTESDWPHLWLSEGFATYLTDLYFEDTCGSDSLKGRMRQERSKVLAFAQKHNTPVVDTTKSANLMKLLNANSYQKGAWVLHMLRNTVGDSLFWKGVRTYYATYAGGNASTDDLMKIFQKTANRDLSTFFEQWLYRPGQPELNIRWKYKAQTIELHIEQTQKKLFEFPLEIAATSATKSARKTFAIKERSTRVEMPVSFKPDGLEIDPDVKLLFRQGTVKRVEE